MKINKEELDLYGSESAGFFSLKDNGDKAAVRFLYETPDDVDLYAVHRVELPNGSRPWISCLRTSYNSPLEECPLCARGRESKDFSEKSCKVKLWIPVFNVTENEVQIWERGKKFYKSQLIPAMMRQAEPFCGNLFEVERIGATGDRDTKYDLIFLENDEKSLDDFDNIEIPNIIGTVLLEKTYEELENFVNTRTFDGTGTSDDSVDDSVERRGSTYNGGGISERRRSGRPSML